MLIVISRKGAEANGNGTIHTQRFNERKTEK